MEAGNRETEQLFRVFEEQVSLVMEAIKRDPSREKQILSLFITRFFDAIKETVRSQNYI